MADNWSLKTGKKVFLSLSKTILKIYKFWFFFSFIVGFCSDRFETVSNKRKTLHVYLFYKFKTFYEIWVFYFFLFFDEQKWYKNLW